MGEAHRPGYETWRAMMMDHIDTLMDDYVLGLVTNQERHAVQQHVAGCDHCMKLLIAERDRTLRLATTLRQACSPQPGRLKVLWPRVARAAGIARPRAGRVWRPQWRALATAAALAVFMLAGVRWTMEGTDGWLLSTYTPTIGVATSSPTVSATPTAQRAWTQLATAEVALRPFGWGTAEPILRSPEPRPNPAAPPAAD